VKYLLDTNIISELQKPQCNPKVKAFIEHIPGEDIYTSALSMGELCYGMEKLPPGKKKHELAIWLYTKVPEWFNGRIIPFDTEVMMEWGKICARASRTLPVADTLIAAAAITHHLILITRNTNDFKDIEGLNLMNPWE